MKMSTPNGRWHVSPSLDGNYESKPSGPKLGESFDVLFGAIGCTILGLCSQAKRIFVAWLQIADRGSLIWE
jgi:hypothetical protein